MERVGEKQNLSVGSWNLDGGDETGSAPVTRACNSAENG